MQSISRSVSGVKNPSPRRRLNCGSLIRLLHEGHYDYATPAASFSEALADLMIALCDNPDIAMRRRSLAHWSAPLKRGPAKTTRIRYFLTHVLARISIALGPASRRQVMPTLFVQKGRVCNTLPELLRLKSDASFSRALHACILDWAPRYALYVGTLPASAGSSRQNVWKLRPSTRARLRKRRFRSE